MIKHIKKFTLSIIALTFLFTNSIQGSENDLTILFTHDIHDNIEPYSMEIDGEIVERGGISRLYTAILNEKSKAADPLIIDGGDYSQGTLFQSIFTSHAPMLHLFGMLGYDATTYGNHEFDFRPQGLDQSLQSALGSGMKVVDIVSSNTNYDIEDKSDALSELEKTVDDYGVQDYLIVEKNGVKIGIMGLMGLEADSNAPMAEVEFENYISAAKRVSSELKEQGVDMIVALSHAGTSENAKQSEDEILAKEVSDLDVILSAHSHTLLNEPIRVGNTTIISAGRYGQNLGKLVVSPSGKRWDVKEYEIIPIDNSLEKNVEVGALIDTYKEAVNQEYLNKYGLAFEDVIAYAPYSFTPATKLSSTQEEEPLAHLIGDAYIKAVKEIEKDNYDPVDIAVVPSGVLRDSITEGNITVSDAFKILPLGVGKDGISGYPLLSVYLSGKEIKLAAEIDASISPILSFAKLYLTGMSYDFNPNRIILNKVTDVKLFDGINKSEIEDDKLYRVVADLYTAQMLSVVNDQSFGLLSITPKDKDGKLVTDFEDHIIYDNNQEELKMWVALTDYLKGFDKNADGVSEIPERYANYQGYKTVDQSSAVFSKFTKLNVFSLSIIGIILFLIILVGLLVRFIYKRIKRRRPKYSK